MDNNKVSIIIPSRKERFLQKTIDTLFENATGDIEIIAILDGYWPDPVLKDDPRLIQLHRTSNLGMRPGINAAVSISKGKYLFKIDGHCMVGKGFDEILKADCADNWMVVPRRFSLDAELWQVMDKKPVDYHFLSYPYERPGDRTCGLHGQVWSERATHKKDILIDDEMSSQGSCYFTTRKWWDVLGPMEIHNYGTFAQEFQELGMKTWLGGGEVKINKKTWYAHLHKGSKWGTGYGFTNDQWRQWIADKEAARLFTIDFSLHNKWEKRVHDFEWLIEKFSPVPTWPEDWREKIKN